MWQFHRFFNFDAVGNKGELITFWGQKVKVIARPCMVK